MASFEIPILRIALQQPVHKTQIGLRPVLGIARKHSNQPACYFARGRAGTGKVTRGHEDKLLVKKRSPFLPSVLFNDLTSGLGAADDAASAKEQ